MPLCQARRRYFHVRMLRRLPEGSLGAPSSFHNPLAVDLRTSPGACALQATEVGFMGMAIETAGSGSATRPTRMPATGDLSDVRWWRLRDGPGPYARQLTRMLE